LGTFWFRREPSPPPLEIVCSDYLLHHARGQTLLEPAKLAPVPPSFVDGAVFIRQTNVLGVLLNCSLEKSLAPFAGSHSVMLARCVVPTNGAEQASLLSLIKVETGPGETREWRAEWQPDFCSVR